MDLNSKDLIEEVLDSPQFKFFKDLKLSNMPRAERRRKEKDLKKMERAVRSFTPEQAKLIEKLIMEITNQEVSEFSGAVDRVITAYLILKNEDKSWEEIMAMQDEIAELLSEDCKKYKELISCEGDINMGRKTLEKFQGEVKERAKQLIQSRAKAKDAIDILIYEFPAISKATATNGYKKVEQEMKELQQVKEEENKKVKEVLGECDKETADHLEYIFNEDNEAHKDIKKVEEVSKNKNFKKKEVVSEITKKVEETKAIKHSKLKVLNWVKNVEGTNGMYVVSSDGVKLQEGEKMKNFKTIDDVDKYYKVKLDELTNYTNEIKEVFGLME